MYAIDVLDDAVMTVNPNFDTGAARDALVNGGLKQSEAVSIIETIKLSQEHLATHSDISNLASKFDSMLQKHTYLILGGILSMLTVFTAILKIWPN